MADLVVPWMTESRTRIEGTIVPGELRQRTGYGITRPAGSGDWLLIYTVSGSGLYTANRDATGDGGAYRSEAGDVTLYPPGARQSYGADPEKGAWHLVYVHFIERATWEPWLNWPEHPSGMRLLHIPQPERARLLALLRKADRLAATDLPQHDDLAFNALEEFILWCESFNPRQPLARLDRRVRTAVEWLASHYAKPVSLEDVAKEVGLSLSRFAHLFREQVGVSPQRFLESQRIGRARQLLETTDETAASIADAVGYQSPFYFSLRFKKVTGFSPTDYRARHRRYPVGKNEPAE